MSAPPDFLFINAARIVTHGDGTYTPAGNGQIAAVMGVHDGGDELCDLVAWFLDNPTRWWLRHSDDCPVLGAGNIELAVLCHEPITLHPTPEAWALAAGRGVCVLDWGAPLLELFEGVPAIECGSPALRHRLQQAFRRWAPRITLVPQEARHAA